MSKRSILTFVLVCQFALSSAMLRGQAVGGSPGGVCLPSIKSQCVSDCSQQCGDVGECIFGCEIGQFTSTDQCNFDCNGLGDACVQSCLATVTCITNGCEGNFTDKVALNLGTIVYNRATGIWQQTVRVTNISGETLGDLAYVVDTLASGWTVINADGVTSQLVPAGSPYKNFADLASNATATVVLQFSRAGTGAFTYSPRVGSASYR